MIANASFLARRILITKLRKNDKKIVLILILKQTRLYKNIIYIRQMGLIIVVQYEVSKMFVD